MDYVAQSFFLSLFKKRAPLSPIPYGTPFLLAFLTTVSKARTHMHTLREEEEEREEGEGGRGRRCVHRDKQRFAHWDLWFNVPGQMLRLFTGSDKQFERDKKREKKWMEKLDTLTAV